MSADVPHQFHQAIQAALSYEKPQPGQHSRQSTFIHTMQLIKRQISCENEKYCANSSYYLFIYLFIFFFGGGLLHEMVISLRYFPYQMVNQLSFKNNQTSLN